jgi:flagellar basal-body rod protein FlgC
MSTLDTAISAAATGLRAERVRIETAVSNIANAETTRGPDGQPYRRRDVVLTTDPVNSFDSLLGAASATGVKVAGVVEDQQPFERRYEPSHPDADSDGYVSLPNVDPAEEMVNMLGATRAYQANLAAVGMIRDLMTKALELAKA